MSNTQEENQHLHSLVEIDDLNAQAYLIRITNPTLAIEQVKKILELSEFHGYTRGFAEAYRTWGAATSRTERNHATECSNKAVELFRELGDESGEASAMMTLYVQYHHFGWYERGFSLLKDALDKAMRSGNYYVAAIALSNMGVCAEERGEMDVAIDYYDRAREIAKTTQNDHTLWSATSSAAILRARRGELNQIEVLTLACENFERIGSLFGLFDNVCNIASIYASNGEFAKSLMTVRWAKKITLTTGDLSSLVTVYEQYAEIMHRVGKHQKSLRLYQSGLTLATEIGYKMGQCRLLERVAFVERELGHHEASGAHLFDHLKLKEELAAESSENRMSELQSYHRIELAEAETKIAKLKAEELAEINHQLETALEQQAHLQRELMRLASTDELTGALNRRHLVNDGTLEMERYRHMGAPFSVTLIDIDHFKQINDTFGHGVGDEILRRLTKCCLGQLRRFDVFGRLGGEEFCIIHHDTPTEGAMIAAERLMKAISSIEVFDVLGERSLTVSIGISEVHKDHSSFYDVLHDADGAMYESKRAGRNTYRTCQSRSIEVKQLESNPLQAA